jgi:multidrug resistance efflux pump
MRRLVFVPVLIVLAILAFGGGIAYYLYQSYLYYHTDDAQVSGTIVSISAPAAGQLTNWNVSVGSRVKANDVIGTITEKSTTTGITTVNVTSPIDGTIVQNLAVTGQLVNPTVTQLASVVNLSTLTVMVYVDEGAISNVKVGQSTDVTIDAYSGTTISGQVQQIVQATAGSFSLLPNEDRTSGNFTKVSQRVPVIISISGYNGNDIVPGMSASVTIHIH